MTTMERARRLTTITTLYHGSHAPDGQHCAMEAAAYVAGEPWSDTPACVSPVIAAFLRSWNDDLPSDADRTRLLLPLVLPSLDTRCDAATDTRLAWMAVDWLTRVQAPAWLRLTTALRAHGEALASLPEITVSSWPSATSQVAAAWDAARAAGAAAGAAAWAAWDAARAAAWDAARAAGDAGDAGAAGAAAGAAARAALKTTTHELQGSATSLVLRMCRIAKGEER